MVDSVGFLVCFWPSGRHVDLRSQGAEGHHAARGGGAECPPLDRRAAPWAVFLSVFYLFWASGTAFWGERIGFSDLGNFFSHCLEGLMESETCWWSADGVD